MCLVGKNKNHNGSWLPRGLFTNTGLTLVSQGSFGRIVG